MTKWPWLRSRRRSLGEEVPPNTAESRKVSTSELLEHLRRTLGAFFEPLAASEEIRTLQLLESATVLPEFWLVVNQVRTGLLWCAEVATDPQVADLLRSAAGKVENGVQSILSTPPPRVVDEARFLMEVEFLLRDFAIEPTRIQEWATLDLWSRNSKYGFGKCRSRVENALGLPKGHVLPDKAEYSVHSAGVHPQPDNGNPGARPSVDERQARLDADLSDLIVHGWRVLEAFCGSAEVFITQGPSGEIDLSLDLAAVREFLASRQMRLEELGFPERSPFVAIKDGPEEFAANVGDLLRSRNPPSN